MSPASKTSKAVLLLTVFSLTIGAVAAQNGQDSEVGQIDIQDGDEVIWKQSSDTTLNFNVSCKPDYEYKSANLRFAPLDNKEGLRGEGSENRRHDFKSVDTTGRYIIEAKCGEGTIERTITLDEMDYDLEGLWGGEDWYVGFNQWLNVSISSDQGNFSADNLNYVSVELDGDSKETPVSKSDSFSDEMTLEVSGDDLAKVIDDENDETNVTVDVDAHYENGDEDYDIDVSEKEVNLHKWRVNNVDVNPDDSLTASQFTQLNVDADIYFKGDPVNKIDLEDGEFGPENFYLEQNGHEKDGSRWFDGDLINPDKGRYSISIGPTPQELEETMNVVFDAGFEGNDYTVDVAEIDVENIKKFLWNTKVLTPDQDAVEADFRVNYEDSYVNFTSTNGDFSEKLWPGDPTVENVEVEFPTSRLSLNEVELDEENSGRNILYNYIYYSGIDEVQSPDTLEGIKPVNLASYSFGYPLESGKLDMRFNNEQIDSAEAVKVFECTEWHFGDKECRSSQGWDEVDDVTTVPASWKSTKYSTSEFNIDTHDWENEGEILQNAYIVGTSADLVLNGVPSIEGAGREGRVETGGEITVSQTLSSENDNPVSGADVTVSFYEGEDEIKTLDTVETDSEGSFSVTGDAPLEPGNYSIVIEAEADNFNDLETRYEEDPLEVFVAEGVSIDAESTLEVTLGQETSTMVDVDNTGQTEMQNVELSFSGLNSDFYSVSRSNLGDIEAGESATTEVTFDIPESYGVEDYPELQIDVTAENGDGEEFEDSEEILAQLTYGSDTSGSEESETSDTEEEEGSSFSPDDAAEITGEFLDSQSSLNIALGLILVFMMALVGAVKKKKQEDDDRRRNGRPAVQKPSVQQQEDSTQSQEEDEDEDVDSQIDEIAGAFNESEGEETQDEEHDEVEDEELDEVVEATSDENESEEEETEDKKDEEQEKFACSVCGEEFDSESGRDLHEDIAH